MHSHRLMSNYYKSLLLYLAIYYFLWMIGRYLLLVKDNMFNIVLVLTVVDEGSIL